MLVAVLLLDREAVAAARVAAVRNMVDSNYAEIAILCIICYLQTGSVTDLCAVAARLRYLTNNEETARMS